MPAVLELASTTQSWSDLGADCNRSPPSRCRSMCLRLGPAALVRRSSSAACIGFGPSLSPRSNIQTGTDDNLLRQVIYQGLHEDKDPTEVRCPVPNQPASAAPKQIARQRRSRL